MSCVFEGAMAKRDPTETQTAPEPPALDPRDASALRSFIEAMISARAVATLVHWLLAFTTQRCKAHDDLLERLSHARSKFVEDLNRGDSRSIPALVRYARRFAIEAESKALREDFDAPLARRIVGSKPLIQEQCDWVDAMRPKVEPRSPLGTALTYLTRQRPTLEVFLEDGRLAMTNNAVGRELRTHVLNRKTWLFCGSEQSAKRMAAVRTIVRTCKLLGVEPRAYLRFVVRRILAGERDPTVLCPETFAATDAALRAPAICAGK